MFPKYRYDIIVQNNLRRYFYTQKKNRKNRKETIAIIEFSTPIQDIYRIVCYID